MQQPPFQTLLRAGATLAGAGLLLAMLLPPTFKAMGYSLIALGGIAGLAGFGRRAADLQASTSLQSNAGAMIATWTVTPEVWQHYVDELSRENGETGLSHAIRASVFLAAITAVMWYFAEDKSDFLATAVTTVPVMGFIFGLGIWWYRARLERLRASEPSIVVTRSALAIGRDVIPWTLGSTPRQMGQYSLKNLELSVTPVRRIRLEIEFQLRGRTLTRWISIPAPADRDVETDVLMTLRRSLPTR
jgi:hypothetical protein